MQARIVKTKQLQLDLHWGYMKKLNATSEKLDFYETMTKALLGDYPTPPDKGPLWDEINRPK